MSLGLWVFVVSAAAMVVATAHRGVQTYRTVTRFRSRWPELLAAHASLDVEAVRMALHGRRVSILIPAWNERDTLPRVMADVGELPLPNLEVLVSAGGEDGTLQVALEQARSQPALFRVFEQSPGQGKQRALRNLFSRASGDIIYLTDADCRLTLELVAATLAPILFDGETATTTGGVPAFRHPESNLAIARRVTELASWLRHRPHTDELNGQNAACDARVLREAEAFSEDAPIGTDVALSRLLTSSGHRIRYVAWPLVESELDSSLPAMARQLSRWVRNPWYHAGRVPTGKLLLSATWWVVVVAGTLSYPPVSLGMVALTIGYLYALQPGLYVLPIAFPEMRVHHPAFIAVALLHQLVPILALCDHLSSDRRERW